MPRPKKIAGYRHKELVEMAMDDANEAWKKLNNLLLEIRTEMEKKRKTINWSKPHILQIYEALALIRDLEHKLYEQGQLIEQQRQSQNDDTNIVDFRERKAE